MAATFRSASSNNGGSGTAAAYAVTLPAGWQPGDLVLVMVAVASQAVAFSSLAGWTLDHSNDQCSTATSSDSTTAVYYRIMQSGDADPRFTGTTTGKWAWVAIAVQPGVGETIAVDTQATVVIQDSNSPDQGFASITPGSAAAAATDCSVLFADGRSFPTGSTAITYTSPTGWTTRVQTSTAVGNTVALKQISAYVGSQDGVIGTVTPGSVTYSRACYGNAYHYLVSSTGAGGLLWKPRLGPNYRR